MKFHRLSIDARDLLEFHRFSVGARGILEFRGPNVDGFLGF